MKTLVVSVLFFTSWMSLAQDSPPQIDTTLEVNYVTLDVVVRNKKGRLLTDLTREDFKVLDQGRVVAIETFRILDYRSTALTQITVDEPMPVRQFVLAIDSEAMRLQEGVKCFAQLRDFIRQIQADGLPYQVLIHSLDKHSRNAAFVDNASEAMAVLKTLEEDFKKQAKPYVRPDWYDRQEMALLDENPVDQGDLSQYRLANFTQLEHQANDLIEFEAACQECIRLWGNTPATNRCIADSLDHFQGQQRDRSRRVFLELTKLAGQFEDVDGLKVLLFVSKGFINSISLAAEQIATHYAAGSARGVTGRRLLHYDFDLEDEFQQVVHACTEHRAVFHTFHTFDVGDEFGKFLKKRGNRADLFRIYRGYDLEISEGLRNLAEASGGTFHRGSKWAEDLVPVLTDQNFFYVLAYPQPEGKSGKFRKIKIKIKRKGAKAFHRQGYFRR